MLRHYRYKVSFSFLFFRAPLVVVKMHSIEQQSEAATGSWGARIDQLIADNYNIVYAVTLAQLRNRDLAEDATQEAFLRAYLSLEQLKDPQRFPVWVCRIARNVAMDWLRSPAHARRMPLTADFEMELKNMADTRAKTGRDIASEAETCRDVQKVLDQLPPETREVLVLHHVEGLNFREIADRLNIHPTTVRYRLGRAVAQGRALLGDCGSLAAAVKPEKTAVARLTSVLAGAGTLSAAARESLAAKAIAYTTPVTSTISSTAAPNAASNAASLAAYVGGFLTGTKQIAAATAAVFAAITGGTAIYVAQENATAPPPIMQGADTPGAGNIIIKHSSSASGTPRIATYVKGKVLFSRAPLTSVLTYSTRSGGPWRFELAPGLTDIQLDVECPPKDAPDDDLTRAVLDFTGLRLTEVQREMDAYVLSTRAERPPLLQESARSKGFVSPYSEVNGPTGIISQGGSLDELAYLLERMLNRPIIDDTGLTTQYDYVVQFQPDDSPEGIRNAMRQLGLEFAPARWPVPVLLVEKRNQD